MMTKRILIVDDEIDLSELLAYNLHRAGYATHVAHNGRTGLEAVASFKPDLIVLDVMMPEMTGTQVAERLKRDGTTRAIPIIMLTAKAAENDELSGFAAGVDDYVTKPFTMRVLEARIEAVLRRMALVPVSAQSPDAALRFGPLVLDPDTHDVLLDEKPIRLTVTEFRLLESLINASGRVLSRQALIIAALGPGVTVTERTIDVHITSIRKKLGPHADLVRTVRGVGYRLQEAARALAGESTRPKREA
jgi:two-component system phosphate regulon response regulator PhoB